MNTFKLTTAPANPIIHHDPIIMQNDYDHYLQIVQKDYPLWTPEDHNFVEVVLTEEEAEAMFAMAFPHMAEL